MKRKIIDGGRKKWFIPSVNYNLPYVTVIRKKSVIKEKCRGKLKIAREEERGVGEGGKRKKGKETQEERKREKEHYHWEQRWKEENCYFSLFTLVGSPCTAYQRKTIKLPRYLVFRRRKSENERGKRKKEGASKNERGNRRKKETVKAEEEKMLKKN